MNFDTKKVPINLGTKVGVGYIIIVPLVMEMCGKGWQTALTHAAIGFATVLASNISELKEISLGPLKAKLRIIVEEANATLEQLRTVALAISKASLDDIMAGNFFDGMTFKARMELHDHIINELKKIGLSDKQLSQATENWNKGITVIYHYIIQQAIEQRTHRSQTNHNLPKDKLAACKGFQNLLDFPTWTAPPPETMRMYIESNNLMTDETEKWLHDYEHFCNTGELLHPDDLIHRQDKWGQEKS